MGPAKNDLSRPVVIEDDCWLGINVVVCPGVTVGRGTVVGANAVVTSSTLPYSIVAGAPARLIGQRLGFYPPISIRADSIEDIPYFYAGFVLPSVASSPIRAWYEAVRQGRWALKRFALVLKVETASVVHLRVMANDAIHIWHEGDRVKIQPGLSTARFVVYPDSRGLLWFTVENWKPLCLAVSSAWLEGAE